MVKETLNPKGLGTSVWELFRSCISFQVCFSQAVALMMRKSWLLLVTSQFSFNRKKSEPIAGWPWFVSTHRLQRGVQVCFGINWLPLLTHQFPVKNGQSPLNCWKHSELPVQLFFPLKAGNEAPSAQTALQTLWQPVPALTPLCSSASSNSWAKMSPVPDVLYQSCQAIPFSAPRNSWKCCSFPGKERRAMEILVWMQQDLQIARMLCVAGRLCLWKHLYLGEKKERIQLHSDSQVVMRTAWEGRLKSARVQPLCCLLVQKWSLPHVRQETPCAHGLPEEQSNSCCPSCLMASWPYARHPSPLCRQWNHLIPPASQL